MKKIIYLKHIEDISDRYTDVQMIKDGCVVYLTFGDLKKLIPDIMSTEEDIVFEGVFDTEDYKGYDFLFSSDFNAKTIEPLLAKMYEEIKGMDITLIKPIGWYLNACRKYYGAVIEIQ